MFWNRQQSHHFSPGTAECAPANRLIFLLLLLALPAAVQAQFTFTTNNDTLTLAGYAGSDSALVIPSTNDGLPVTSIGDAAFYNCTSLTKLTVGDSITNLESWAFYGCTNLTEVYFHGNAPRAVSSVFHNDNKVTVYCLPGTTGWSDFSVVTKVPAVLWNPQIQTGGGNFGVGTNGFGFNITGTANIPMVIEACTDLANSAWFALQSCTLTNGSLYFSDPEWTNYLGRFYRLRSP